MGAHNSKKKYTLKREVEAGNTRKKFVFKSKKKNGNVEDFASYISPIDVKEEETDHVYANIKESDVANRTLPSLKSTVHGHGRIERDVKEFIEYNYDFGDNGDDASSFGYKQDGHSDDDDTYMSISETGLKQVHHGYLKAPDNDTDTDFSDISMYLTTDSETSLKKRVKPGSIEDVPFMVDAFKPLIERSIQVMEIIPHLPFIDAAEFINMDNPVEAMSMLIARLKSSEEQGKWQAFLHALSVTEYEYIVRLLRGDTEEDHTVNRFLLKIFTPQIMQRMDPEEFIDHLFEKNVINERDMQEVKCEQNRRGANAASFMLLEKVPKRASNWCEIFHDVLVKCGMEDIATNFKQSEIPSFKPETTIPKSGFSLPILTHPRKRYSKQNSHIRTSTSVSNSLSEIGRNMDDAHIIRSKSSSEIMALQREVDSLREVVVEKKQIKQLRMEIKALKEQVEALNEVTLEGNDNEVRTSLTSNEQVLESLSKKCDKETATEDFGSLESEPKIPDYQILLETIGSKIQDDCVKMIVKRMQVELSYIKDEIASLKDHFADALVKTAVCSRSDGFGVSGLHYPSYVTFNQDWFTDGQPSHVKLYNTSTPKPHFKFVNDSGICSGIYIPKSNNEYHDITYL